MITISQGLPKPRFSASVLDSNSISANGTFHLGGDSCPPPTTFEVVVPGSLVTFIADSERQRSGFF